MDVGERQGEGSGGRVDEQVGLRSGGEGSSCRGHGKGVVKIRMGGKASF